ncbi:MAG: FG-GAP repeat protein [Planctomycetota bacterium]
MKSKWIRNRVVMGFLACWVSTLAIYTESARAVFVPELTQSQKLLASDGVAFNALGYNVAISGDVLILGQYDSLDHSPGAYVFRNNGSNWSQEQKLVRTGTLENDFFGYSVSVDGDVSLVGAPYNSSGAIAPGAAYIFRWNGSTWIEEQKLIASDGVNGDLFGHAVSLSGNIAMVGARGDDDSGGGSGSVYAFHWNGTSWIQRQKLLASDGANGDAFGEYVALSGGVVVVGAKGDDDNGPNSGSAYIFRWNGFSWFEEQKLLPSDGTQNDLFGERVAVFGNTALVGADDNDDNGGGSGSAYVFRWNGASWYEEQKLLPSDGSAGDGFGRGLGVSGNVIVVGAYGDDIPNVGDLTGSAYMFEWDGSEWLEQYKLRASDAYPGDEFGFAVAVSYGTAVVGAFSDDDNGVSSGSAYVFDLPTVCCDGDGDGIDDNLDNCISVPNPAQTDSDGDFVGDLCDNCPFAQNPTQTDSNQNGIGDACECTNQCTTVPFADIAPCGGNGIIDLDDLIVFLEAFAGNPLCPDPCVR